MRRVIKLMNSCRVGLALTTAMMFPLMALAQVAVSIKYNDTYKEVRGAAPENKPPKTTFAEIIQGDTVPVAVLNGVFSFPKENFSSTKDEKYYWKLVNDVKIVRPYSKIVYFTLLETMNYLETISDPKEKERHLRQMERDLVKEYEPVLRKMSFNQGKILLKLINRECNSSSYDLIKAYRGSFAAGFWQGVARLFRTDLKSGYNPEDEDYTLERIVIRVDQGLL
jgi:hypothetical protein